MFSLVAVIILATALCPVPAEAESAAYIKALAAYNQATAEVNQAQARLSQAQAVQAHAQAKYDQANTAYEQLAARDLALDKKIHSLGERMGEISGNPLLSAEYHRLHREWHRAWETRDNLKSPLDRRRNELGKAYAVLSKAKRDVQYAQKVLSWAKQDQLVALRALQRLRDQAQQQVSYELQFGAGVYNYPHWLMQILDRWNQNQLPGSSIHIHHH
jgi:chromosome segregation ATPase